MAQSVISETLYITIYCYGKPCTNTHKKHKLTPKGRIINDLEAVYGVLKYSLKHILLKVDP